VEEVEPTEWVDPTVRGQVLHWICERLREPEQVSQLIEQALERVGVAGTPAAEGLAHLAAVQVEAWVKSPLFERLRSGRVETEKPFSLEIGGLLIEGRIDAVGIDAEGRSLLVDYKTNRVSLEEVPSEARGYELQMGIYGLAARSLGYPVEEAVLYFLEPGVEHPVPVDPAAVEARVAELGTLLRGTSLEIADYPQNLGACGKCRFRAVCGT
jgi:ATP-dependent helicase/nuclease subunit A